MNKTYTAFAILLAVVGISAFLIFSNADTAAGRLDEFAQCLAGKEVTMYGADWCPHCQSEKKAFGQSFRFIPYVECPENPNQCLDAGINSYPTWIFPDGEKLEGEQGLKRLSQASGCLLPTGD